LRSLNSHSGIYPAPLLGLLHCSIECEENAMTLFYDIALVTDIEAEEAVSAADAFLLLVEADIKKRTPEGWDNRGRNGLPGLGQPVFLSIRLNTTKILLG
jgi:hypothetical protein